MKKTLLALWFCLASCCLLTPKTRAFEATTRADESLRKRLTTAIERLDQQGSYRWTSEVEVPEEIRFRPGPTRGTTVQGGVTHVSKPQPRLSDAEAAALLSRRGKRDVGVHDPSSIVKCDGEYWFFSTGIGVSSWRSKDLRTWQRGPRAFPEIPHWVTDVVPGQRGHFWAPDVIHLDDRYFLYYSVSSFGKNTSAIALASSSTLNPDDPAFRWTDQGIVIQSSGEDDFNAIDPAVIRTESGELWMSFGSFWNGLKLIRLDPKSGKRMEGDRVLRSIASYRQIEAPHIHQHDGWFYLFVNWGKCCSGVDSTYNIRVGRSRTITGPYLDKDGVDLVRGGGTLLLGSDGPFIGPGHASVFRDGNRFLMSCHYYDGTERGRSRLSIQGLSWSKEGWPIIGETTDSDQTSTRVDQLPDDWVDPHTGHRVVRLSKQAVDLSTHDYDLEPNVTFTPDGQWIVFRSNMHGERHVYMVSVEKETE